MSTPAGWYPQPDGQQRYWDGEQWTEDFEAGAGTPVTTGATGGQQARLRFKKKHVIGYTATALVALAIGAASTGGTNSKTNAGPASDTLPVPALTVTSTVPGPATTITVPGPAVTKTVTKTVPGPAVTQSPPPAAAPQAQPAPGGSSLTTAQENAKQKAQSYLDMGGFSRSGLIDQLKFEGFSTGDASSAVDSMNVNWNTQAERKAKSYVEMSGFSRSGLIDQLVFEGFTAAQAAHGADFVGL